jgi:hypothetical protein
MNAKNSDAVDSGLQLDQQQITDAVQAIAASRSLIDQTKGMLMFVYGIDADKAFELLRWQSQQHNVKLRLIAAQIREDLLEMSRQETSPSRRLSADNRLLTAHGRVVPDAARLPAQLPGRDVRNELPLGA